MVNQSPCHVCLGNHSNEWTTDSRTCAIDTRSHPQLSKTQAELQKGKAEAAAYAKDAKNATIQEIDKFDKKVEEKAAQAKSGISSWFGGK